MPFFSCIVLSHDKPDYVGEAINSLLAQTFLDWEAVILDSGVLYDRRYFETLPAMKDPRMRLICSWETEEIRKTKTIASWCFNECFRRKLLNGLYVTYLCDDDLLYPNAFQAFHDFARTQPDTKAMYASVDMTGVRTDGAKVLLRELLAEEIKGSCCGGGSLDCQVDYLQLCHKADLFELFPDEDFWPEDREVIQHADGIFLEKIGSIVPIFPIPVKIGENRKVPTSLNTGGERLADLLEIHRLGLLLAESNRVLAESNRELEILRGRSVVCPRCSVDCLRYRVVDKLNEAIQWVPALHRVGKKILLTGWRMWQKAVRQAA